LSGRSEVEELFGREKSIEVDQLFYREVAVRESLSYLGILFWCLHAVPSVIAVEDCKGRKRKRSEVCWSTTSSFCSSLA
jgi:hypothetical protein